MNDMGMKPLTHEEVELIERLIGEIDNGFDKLNLATREGWAIASTAVMAARMLSEAWREDPSREHELRGGLRIASGIVSRMSESMSGRVTSNAACMRALIDDPAGVVGRIGARAAQMCTLGDYNNAHAVERLSAVLSPELTIALIDAEGTVAARLRGILDMAAPGAGFAAAVEDKVNAPEQGAVAAERGGKGVGKMTENNMDAVKKDDMARIRIHAEQVKLTDKVFDTSTDLKMRGAFIHLPKGTVIDGRDFSDYEIYDRIPEFLADKVRDGADITLRFDPKWDISVFKGFAEDGTRKDEEKFNPHVVCSAIKQAYTARDEARDKYCKISVPRSNVHPFDKVNEATGEVVKKAAVKLPAGTNVDGRDLGGRSVFLYMSKFNEQDMENKRDFIRFSIRRDAAVYAVGDKGADIEDVRVGAEALSCAVDAAVQASERESADSQEADYPGLSDLETVARAGSDMSASGATVEQAR